VDAILLVRLTRDGTFQSFDKVRLVLADDLRGELLNRISPAIADSGMELSYCELGFLSIIAP
jgi:hypothetical protein